VEIAGHCDPRFSAVRDALAENFTARGELGAAVSVTLAGEPVVDIWGGSMDVAGAREWQKDTLVDVFSVGKAVAALCVLILVDRGEIDLHAPVSRYWPQFAAAGKDGVMVRTLLAHRAGLPAVRRDLNDYDIYDWHLITAALAAEEPWWEPDTTHGYHTNTFGFLAGELVRRVGGESLGAFCRREVAGPLGADCHIGVDVGEADRIAAYVFGSETDDPDGGSSSQPDDARRYLLSRVYLNPPGLSGIGTVNTRAWRAAEIPSANAHATARGVANIFSNLIGEEPLLRRATLDSAIREASYGTDFVLGRPSRFGLGFQLTQPERMLGPNPRTFGHFGAGGSLAFADPDAGLAFAYTMNLSGPRWQNPRNRALIDAVYACLEGINSEQEPGGKRADAT
jgi:CubicO group peptidase (beta-lactamase class C family)